MDSDSIRAVSQSNSIAFHPCTYLVLSISVVGIYLYLVYVMESSVSIHQKKDRATRIAMQFNEEQRKRRAQNRPRLDSIIEDEAESISPRSSVV
ncbi:hypothetical protein THRCLA_21887 [Thraustotheca clavata]|uniref:Transmembrane protein n=1 Tax=Thraustotheca clavata TaxID=74557 RepID=A0A1V9ZKS9_9STRA|nr:hypothetical protein THRCLA_21887 [Thraustotheca clavata]